MKRVTLAEANTLVRPDGVAMTDFFTPAADGGKSTMGHAVFPAGTVVPWAAHDCDEYSFILSGDVSCETEEDGLCAFSAGSACFIPAGQRHCSRNPGDREAEVLWVLVEKG